MKRLTALLLCLCLLLVGCADDKQAHIPTGNGLTWDEDYTGPVSTVSPEDEESQDLVLTYYPDVTMNPLTCTDFTNRALFSLLYQGLFAMDRSYTAIPILCKSYTVSEDMLTYTFYLERATFSDGTLLTAEDVVASLETARQSRYYGGRFTYINQIQVTDTGAVSISLYTPYENLPLLLDIPIISKDAQESVRPLGTGPYILSATDLGGALRKRANWWCSSDLPIQQSSIRLIAADSATQIRDHFEFGDLSLVCADPGSDRYVDYRCDYELWDCDNGGFLYLGCNESSAIFSNDQVRTALTHAIDRDLLASTYYRGFARSATLPASPLSPYYSQSLASKYEYDPMKMIQAVQSAGLTDANVVLLVNSDDSLRVRVARAIAQMLEDCSLTVTMKEVNGTTYTDSLYARTYDLYLGQTKLSPNQDLSAFFAPYTQLSYGGLDDVALYDLCQLALENHGNYYSLHKAVMDDGHLCPVLSNSFAVYASRGLVTGLSPARDNIFCYSIGKTLDQVLVE